MRPAPYGSTWRSLAATDDPDEMPRYRSLGAADDGITIPRFRSMSAAAPSPMDVAPTEVKIEEGTLTMEQFARLYKKLEKTGVL